MSVKKIEVVLEKEVMFEVKNEVMDKEVMISNKMIEEIEVSDNKKVMMILEEVKSILIDLLM